MACYYYCITDYGVTGNGTTDDTAGIQAAINAVQAVGGALFFPPGSYRISSTLVITGVIRIVGSGRSGSFFVANTPNFDYIQVGTPSVFTQGVIIEHIGFKAMTPGVMPDMNGVYHGGYGATAGSFINLVNCSECVISDFFMQNPYVGIIVSSSFNHLVEGVIQDIGGGLTSPGGGSSCGILVQQRYSSVSPFPPVGFPPGDLVINRILCAKFATTNSPYAYVWVRACGNLWMSDCELSSGGAICLLITGGEAMYFYDNFFDNSLYGIVIAAIENANQTGSYQKWVARSHFIGNWAGAHANYGVFIENTGVNYVDTLLFSNHHGSWNGNNGMMIQSGTNIQVSNSLFCNNGAYQNTKPDGTGTYVAGASGIAIDAGSASRTVQNITMTGNRCGLINQLAFPIGSTRTYPMPSTVANTYRTVGNEYGIYINSSTADYVLAVNNDLSLNNSTGFSGSAPHSIVNNNFT